MSQRGYGFGKPKLLPLESFPTVRTDKEVAAEWNRRHPDEQITECMAFGRLQRAMSRLKLKVVQMNLELEDFTKEE